MAHDPVKEKVGSGAYWMLAVVTLLYITSMIDRQVIGLLIPYIKTSFGVTDLQVSLVSGAAFATFYCLAGLPIGYAVDHYSRRVIIFIGVFIWGLATIACGLAGSFVHLGFARLMVGAGEAALSPAAYSLFGDRFPRHRLGFATGIFGVGATFGTAIAYGFGSQVLTVLPATGVSTPLGLLMPWQATFVIAALPALLILPLVFTFREPRRTATSQARPRFSDGLTYVWGRRKFFIPFFLAYGLLLAGAWAFSMWVPTVLSRRFDMSMQHAGSILGILSAIGAASGAIIFGTITDRLTARGHRDAPMMTFALLALALTAAGLGLAMSPDVKWAIGFALMLFIFSGIPALASAIPMVAPPRLRGQVSAIYLLVGNIIGMGLGPSIVAMFTDYVLQDENMIHWAVATTLLCVGPLASILLLMARRPMRDAVLALDMEMAAQPGEPLAASGRAAPTAMDRRATGSPSPASGR